MRLLPDTTVRTLILSLLLLMLASTAGAQSPDRSAPPPVGPAPALELPPIQRQTLSNGVDVVYMKKSDVPLIQLNLILEAGSVDDQPDQAGLAALTAAMIDEGAGDYDALALADAFEFLGARFFVSSSAHHTTLGLRVPSERFAAAAELLADVLLRPHFNPDELERIRLDRLTSLIRRHDEPTAVASVLFSRTLYGDEHPYGRSSIGSEDFLRSVTVDDLRDFYDRHYTPARAHVVMAGDVSPSVLSALDAVLHGWRGEAGSRASLPEPQQIETRRMYLVDMPGAAQSVIQIGRIGVPRTTDDYYAMNVLNTILGGSFTSRLNQNLREDKGYTYGARSAFDFRTGAGPFVANASVFTGVTAPALQEFINELNAIHEPMAEEEVARAKNFLAMRYPQGFQSVSGIAGRLSDLVMYDLPESSLSDYTARIQQVTRDEVEAAADRYLDPKRVAVIVVGDREQIEQDIRALNLAPLEVLEVTDVLGAVPVL